jgi:putative transcription factor
MNFQDWEQVTWNKTNERKKGETKEQQIKRLQKNGSSSVVTLNKNSGNKQTTLNVDKDKLRKIDKEEDTFVLPKVSLSMGKKIAQLRCEKKLTQKELAFKLSLNIKIIQDYESSKAIPNPNIINKLESILGKIRE